MRLACICTLLVASSLLAQTAPATAPASQPDLPDAIAAVRTFKVGGDRTAAAAIEKSITAAPDQPARRAIAAELAKLLDDPSATWDCKDFVCRQLFAIGSAAEAPALARLLGDDKLGEVARYALEGMADPAADKFLRDALGHLKGKALAGVVNSLGNRRDVQSLPAIKVLLKSSEPEVASAAACAAANLAGESSAAMTEITMALWDALQAAKPADKASLGDALLVCADKALAKGDAAGAAKLYSEVRTADVPAPCKLAAARGLVLAKPAEAMTIVSQMLGSSDGGEVATAAAWAGTMKPEDLVAAFGEGLRKLQPAARKAVLEALSLPSQHAIAAAALKDGDAGVRQSAIAALGSVGQASDVPMLLATAANAEGDGAERECARKALVRMSAEGVDAFIASVLSAPKAAPVRVEALTALGARGARSQVNFVSPWMIDPEEAVRVAAFGAMGALGADDELPAVLTSLASVRGDADRAAAKSALVAVAARCTAKDAAATAVIGACGNPSADVRAMALSALPKTPGEAALKTVRACAADSADTVKDAAVRALADWPEEAAMSDLLDLTGSSNATHAALALRGYVRLAQSLKRTPAQTADLLKPALSAAKSDDNRKLVIGALGAAKSPQSLAVLEPLLSDKAVAEEAAAAVVSVAGGLPLPLSPQVLATLGKAQSVATNPTTRQQAKDLLAKSKPPSKPASAPAKPGKAG
jgi:HEAT repeat protein